MRKLLTIATLSALCALSAFAQQENGDKEVGLGGQFFFQSASGSRTGNASFQFSLGYFASTKNYFGVEADPAVTISTTTCSKTQPCFSTTGAESTSGSTTSTTASGFFGGNYRRMLGGAQGKAFFFLGAGGGVYVFGGGSNFGVVFPEAGVKSYISQKTSLEFAYKMLYEVNTPGSSSSFAGRIENQLAISIRHIF